MNILFITHNRLGDATLSTCILNQLHGQHPHAQFTIVTGKIPAQLFESVPNLKRLIIINKAKYHLHWLKLWSKTVLHHWDIVVDCRGSAISWLLWTKQRFYKYLPNTKHIHRVQRYAGMMKREQTTLPKIWINIEHKQKASDILPQSGHIIAIGPAANWRAKTWRAAHFNELITALRNPDGLYPDAHIIVIAAPGEREQVQEVIDALPENRFIDLVGTQTLLTIAAVMQKCELFIGNDSGLMHMAAAVGTPTIGLFGPTDKNKYSPYGPHCHVVNTPESPEELMNYEGFHWLTCDSLMDSIKVEDVLSNIKKTQNTYETAQIANTL
jgi:ADP-heptose:LPS heptosyltransferase